ncbi:amidohydrolase family protein [Croceivirga thetidis]|uniref:Amidohydrolase family protein n=1 Tax=Croceivirga thetidis TaxID=2721623 RepID=A0ABX1GVY7_9FLAO|nr:amidohydrolase family protein [Croceivirga thetidis]NKI33145.1 amidohydrolase family protein [Croceivirga thetidis]
MPDQIQERETPIFNIHAHIFTKDHVPKYLAKKIVVWPFYVLLGTGFLIRTITWFRNLGKKEYTYAERNRSWSAYKTKMFFVRNPLFNFFYGLFRWVTTAIFAYYLLIWLYPLLDTTTIGKWVYPIFENYLGFMPKIETGWNQFFVLLVLALIFGHIRKSIYQVLKKRLQKMVGKEQLEYLLRYLKILDFSKGAGKNGMSYIFSKLQQQYPPKSKFVVLPMDMEFMNAGSVKQPYLVQMAKLMELKSKNRETLFPFVFVDPRRIAQQDPSQPFFDYDASNPDKITLKPCKLAEYLDRGACGIKIYPALGYYPFDKELLPLWLYCVQNKIPITTHCSVGPIFYRGNKKKAWDRHPIFNEVITGTKEANNQVIANLRLTQVPNKEFQANFTHPLNYCCLLMPHFLKQVLDVYQDQDLNDLFGYEDGELKRDLKGLKINLAHYGGAENWDRFLEKDRQQVANELVYRPAVALNLKNELPKLGNLYAHWHYSDWFSLITSMLIEFENVYSDVSYTTHDTQYVNLLSELMNNKKVNKRILFGTDFYVVSNQKTEKAYWIDMQNQLTPEKWEQLASINPNSFIGLT